MRFVIFFVLFVTSLPDVTPVAAISVFELGEKILEITTTVFQTSVSVVNGNTTKADNAFAELDLVNVQIDEIQEKITKIKLQVSGIVQMLQNLPNTNSTNIRMKQYYLNTYYKEMAKYVRYCHRYANSTLINFAGRVLSEMDNSVTCMMKSVYQQVVNGDFMELTLQRLKPTGKGYLCKEKQSLQQMLHNFFNEILVTNTKSYIVINAAYIFKKFYTQGDFRNEIHHVYEEMKIRTNKLVNIAKSYMAKAPSELWRCDPNKHVDGETFIELRHFLHGFILNKANLDPDGSCRDECEVSTYRKLPKKCNNDNAWCHRQQPCRKVVNCQYIDESMTVCPSKDMTKDNRRYEYVKFRNGRTFGKKKRCNAPLTHLETYIYWIVYRCSYCFCLCDEHDKYSTERTINLRLTKSNTAGNKVVTGLRFVKHNRIIHLQVQEGKLLPFGQIDVGTVRWVPPEDYSKENRNYHEHEDYHVFTWEERDLDLADIMADNGTVITGVQFSKVGTRIHLEVRLTPFNFTTGQLKNTRSFTKHDPYIQRKHSVGKELELIATDIPTLSPSASTVFTTDKYVQFTNTGYDKDAGQTTVPFFDAQPVESTIPVPLSGVGLFHKGVKGYGGYITPRIFTYNFWQHLAPVFPQQLV